MSVQVPEPQQAAVSCPSHDGRRRWSPAPVFPLPTRHPRLLHPRPRLAAPGPLSRRSCCRSLRYVIKIERGIRIKKSIEEKDKM